MVLFRNSCLYLLKYLQRSDSQALKFHRSIKFQKLLGNITELSTLWTAWSGIFFKNRDYHHQHFLQRQYKQVESRNYISTKHSPSNWTELSFMKTSVHLLFFFSLLWDHSNFNRGQHLRTTMYPSINQFQNRHHLALKEPLL